MYIHTRGTATKLKPKLININEWNKKNSSRRDFGGNSLDKKTHNLQWGERVPRSKPTEV
jgi:hypothetical protein